MNAFIFSFNVSLANCVIKPDQIFKMFFFSSNTKDSEILLLEGFKINIISINLKKDYKNWAQLNDSFISFF